MSDGARLDARRHLRGIHQGQSIRQLLRSHSGVAVERFYRRSVYKLRAEAGRNPAAPINQPKSVLFIGSYAAFFGNFGSDAILARTLPDVIGQNYTFSFWLKTDGSAPTDYSALFDGDRTLERIESRFIGLHSVQLHHCRRWQRRRHCYGCSFLHTGTIYGCAHGTGVHRADRRFAVRFSVPLRSWL
jgi:hypothetical protein